ncbi:MAG: hypothetical protein [Bacteriophage sp.]|nr:MAG: hypothetical protein [Bacteriophage sp.]
MGFFSKKVFKNNNENTSEQEAQKRVNEDGSEWMQKAYETSKSFNDEDMGGQDAPKRARLYIAAEGNEENTFLTASIVATNKSLLLNSLVKAAHQDEFAETLILAAAAKIRALKRIEEDEKLPKELKDILKTLMENL